MALFNLQKVVSAFGIACLFFLSACSEKMTVQFAQEEQTVAKSAGKGSIAINLKRSSKNSLGIPFAPTSHTDRELLIPFTVSGTAISGVEHNLTSGTARIPRGAGEIGIQFSILDASFQGTKTIVLQLGSPDEGQLGAPTTHTVYLSDGFPTGSIAINNGAVATNSTQVTLSLSSWGSTEMYITSTPGCETGGEWEPYSITKAWTLANENASNSVYVQYRDAAHILSPCYSDSILHDNIPPANGTISINNGDASTTSTSVTLTLAATEANEMYITNTAGCSSGGSWESYATSKAWVLSQNSGTATVYVKFRDSVSNESSCTNDSILLSSGGWRATTTVGAPEGRWLHTAVWTGSKMIVWGGQTWEESPRRFLNSGASFDPTTNEWKPISSVNAPTERAIHTAVWTGSKMIVWGGATTEWPLETNTGGIYNPESDSWTAISTTNAPTGRTWAQAVWTGSKMLIWGGGSSGGIYDPASDTWTTMSTVNQPIWGVTQAAVWSGTKMIVWGGDTGSATPITGGLFDPVLNFWSATSIINTPPSNTPTPQGRLNFASTWTDTELFVWGGETRHPDYVYNLNTGGLYNPATNSWRSTSTQSAPTGGILPCSVWTGSGVLVWSANASDGGIYNPSSDTWSKMNMSNSPGDRGYYSCIWTGKEMVVWGGTTTPSNTGGIYRP